MATSANREIVAGSETGGDERERGAIAVLAALCFLVWTWTSFARWDDFAYRTFDLAYYVQALWQLIHGRLQVSIVNVPLLGNHVEPIVFFLAPLFFVVRHPMLLVAVQNAALATMGPVAYRIGRRLGLDGTGALLLAVALLLAPATGYIALHEFHPEALAAPFLLLMLHAWLAGSRSKHWFWFGATLACKENMALLLIAYCAVQIVAERKRGLAEVTRWFLWPMLAATGWFLICALLITPMFNSGNIDYAALYDRVGSSAGNILANIFVKPQLFLEAVHNSLGRGNLLWALLLPFLALPLLRVRWLLVTGPILLQHLLSWRSSEWMIYFHYGAPLLPFFWFAAAQALVPGDGFLRLPTRARRLGPCLVVTGCIVGQILFGPCGGIVSTTRSWLVGGAERARKAAFVAQIPPHASVVAPLPYLSHLAMREELHSLHYILKGLKTLSHASLEPPAATDYVLIDYADTATFDVAAGFYHPTMRTADRRIIPSSDQLLHGFLRNAAWQLQSANQLTLLRRTDEKVPSFADLGDTTMAVGAGTNLLRMGKSREVITAHDVLEIPMRWQVQAEREAFPWLELRLTGDAGPAVVLTRGLCAVEVADGFAEGSWRVSLPLSIAAGEYRVEAIFSDHTKEAWLGGAPGSGAAPLVHPIDLGTLRILPADRTAALR